MIRNLYGRWRSAYRTKVSNRKAFDALNALDDRELQDIGLCRYDLFAFRDGNVPLRRWR